MSDSFSAEAILFFDEHEIIKQMTYAEFQAILDSYVPLQDIAAKTMNAVYVRIDGNLHVTAAVFFLIPFDREGFVEKSWNIPLQHLADAAAKGPNLGAGPIALVCYSQCPIEWHQKNLWDPAMQASPNDFLTLKKCVKANNLGLVFSKREDEGENQHSVDQIAAEKYHEERTKAAMIIREQRLRQKLLATKSEQDLRQLSLDHQERILGYQQQLNEMQQQLNEQISLNFEMKEDLAGHTEKINGMRDYYENKLQQRNETDNEELESIKEHFKTETMLQVESAIADIKSQLKAKEVEIMYRAEREQKLQQEILALQKENQRLVGLSDGTIIDSLSEAGVNFVIYHPGAGNLNIQPADVAVYLENPISYVANCCGVNEHLYRTWLDHFYSPTCQHEHEDGEICDEPLVRVEDPSQFIIGESDRCSKHQAKVPSVVSISKNGRTTTPAYSTKR